jgi:putative endonuclease
MTGEPSAAARRDANPMTLRKNQLGRKGEAAAAGHLASLGYAVRARNVRTPYGELDLVAVHGESTVFIEVKTRRSRRYGLPEEAVTARKKSHLTASAQYYIQKHGLSAMPWRIDVVAVECDRAGNVQRIEVFENAVFG